MPPSTRRRLSGSERRRAILDAAMEAFATRGYHGTTIDDIASAAGVSKALIYEHFESKRALHETLAGEQAAEIFARLAANAASGSDGAERLRGGVDAFLGFVEERRDAWRALFRDAADPELGDVLDRAQAQATIALAEMMRSDPDAPAMTDRQVEMTAQLVSGAVQALANWWHDHPEAPRSELVDRVMDVFWLGFERLRDRG